MSSVTQKAEMRDALRRLQGGETFDVETSTELFAAALSGAEEAQLAAFLAALAQRGETGDEIAGAARALRAAMTPFDAGSLEHAIDTCGTGGDGLGTFNLSTAAAFVAAGAGARVVKHGNRAVSSRSGSADVLEALGARVDVEPNVAREALDACGFTFLFAPRYHPAMRHAAGVRRALGIRTVFNLTGPLCNPAGVRRQVVGVAAERFVEPVGRALESLGAESALVVHGAGGADELTLAGAQTVRALGAAAGLGSGFAADAATFVGVARAEVGALAGGDAAHNAGLLRRLLGGEPGPLRDATLLNAAAAIAVADLGARDADEALERARESLDARHAARVLDVFVHVTGGAA